MSPIDKLGRATPLPAAQRSVLVVDDHPVIRDALQVLIGRLPGWRLVAEASRARDALGLVSSLVPDIVVMDLALPGMDGVIATREVLRRSPNTKVLILTAHLHPHEVREAFLAGATGYLLKSDSDSLEIALETVVRRGRYLSPQVAALMASTQEDDATAGALASLSEREREVFRLAAECLTNRHIARELCIARKTVDTHLNRIHRKLAIRTSAELVRLAMSFGMVYAGRSRKNDRLLTPPPASTR